MNEKKYFRISRLLLVHSLCKCFDLYHEMQLRLSLLEAKNNYENAVEMSDFINSVFNGDTSPETFIVDKDDTSNHIITLYLKFKESLNSVYIDADAAKVFCERMEKDDSEWCWLRSEGYLYMPSYCSIAINYIIGEIWKEELKDHFVYYKVWEGGKKSKGNFALFRKTFIQVEKMYFDIVCQKLIGKMREGGMIDG